MKQAIILCLLTGLAGYHVAARADEPAAGPSSADKAAASSGAVSASESRANSAENSVPQPQSAVADNASVGNEQAAGTAGEPAAMDTMQVASAGNSTSSVSESKSVESNGGPIRTAPAVDGWSSGNTGSAGNFMDRFWLNYANVFYGPSLSDRSSYQPTPEGERDSELPILLRNYLSAGYALNNEIAISATGYWIWKPVAGQELLLRDPYLRLSDDHLVQIGAFNWYADARAHFGVSDFSRDQDMIGGVQTFHALTLDIPATRFTVGTYGSVRYNFFGSQGAGDDLELYIAPNVAYQLTPSVALTMCYEVRTSHAFGNDFGHITTDETDLEPGVSWDITPKFNLHPYLTAYTNDGFRASATAFGMMMTWEML